MTLYNSYGEYCLLWYEIYRVLWCQNDFNVQGYRQVLRSEPSEAAHLRLNGQTLLRTDPYTGDGEARPSLNPTNIHIDNAFLARHTDATPRGVSRGRY